MYKITKIVVIPLSEDEPQDLELEVNIDGVNIFYSLENNPVEGGIVIPSLNVLHYFIFAV